MRFLIIFVFFLSSALANEVPDIKNIVINKEPKTYDNLTFLDSKNEKVTLSNFKGKLVMLNFWATWCVPCRDEHQTLMKLKDKIKIYGINYKDKKSNAVSFLNELGNPFYFTGIDRDGSLAIEIGAYGIPETYVTNSKGLIVFKHVGPLNEKTYLKINEIIK